MAVVEMELPPPVTQPLDRESEVFGRLRKAARRLAKEVIGDGDVFVLLKTRTRVDVGGWLGRRRVWAAALADSLALFAPGRRPCSERIPFALLRGSTYNHVTGELALALPEGAHVRSLRVGPLDGYQLIAQFRSEEVSHAPTAL
jgi:hypothetical protein